MVEHLPSKQNVVGSNPILRSNLSHMGNHDMINVDVKLPRKLLVAVSGGVDSMAALYFLSRNHEVTACYFDHGTEGSDVAREVVQSYCRDHALGFLSGSVSRERGDRESKEEYWRTIRYEWLNSLDGPVVTAHHLDDCVETWVWSSLNGTPRLPHHKIKNVVRPFLSTPKYEFSELCNRHDIDYVEDASNNDTTFTRNYIRHQMMPHVLKVNPGISKVVRKKVLENAPVA